MKRTSSSIVALVGAALAISAGSYANAGTNHRGEWQTLNTGNKLDTQVYRNVPMEPHALTGTAERLEAEGANNCRRELRPTGNKLTTMGVTCTSR